MFTKNKNKDKWKVVTVMDKAQLGRRNSPRLKWKTAFTDQQTNIEKIWIEKPTFTKGLKITNIESSTWASNIKTA